jgi:hypothetical protein
VERRQIVIFRQIEFVRMLRQLRGHTSRITIDGELMDCPIGTVGMGGPATTGHQPTSSGHDHYLQFDWKFYFHD